MSGTSGRKKPRRGRPQIRFQPDVRVTIRLCPDRDDDLLAWLESLPERQRAGRIRKMLRLGLNGDPEAREAEEPLVEAL